jgi:protein phosphatase
VFAIFDGMGGTEGGEIASLAGARQMRHFVERLRTDNKLTDEQFAELMLDTKKSMEQDIRNAVNDLDSEQPGSTCCGFVLQNGQIRPFWIGDSRLYLLRKNQLILLTKDHTIAQEKIDYGLITPEEAETVSSWHYITKYIGDNQNAFTVGEKFFVESGDKFLLCTDGISDKFKANKLAEYLTLDPVNFIEQVELEVKKQSKDNATAIVIELKSDSDKKEIKDIIKEKTVNYLSAVSEKARHNPFSR